MIAAALKNNLLNDIILNNYSDIQSKVDINHQKTVGYVYALIDMATLTESLREEINEKFADRLYPLITDPSFHELTPLSAHLLAAESDDLAGQRALFDDLCAYNSDVISTWITSVLPAKQLANHLQQTTFAYDSSERQYLLRYYDPLITPILYDEAPANWQHWFFLPIYSWWFARADSECEQWHKLAGYAQRSTKEGAVYQRNINYSELSAPKLIINDELWKSLSLDPLAQHLLKELETQGTAIFSHECKGIRLAQVERAINQAHQHGFTEHQHVCEYVWLAFHYSIDKVISHTNWKSVKQQVLQKQNELLNAVQTLIITDNKVQFKLN